VEQQALGRNVLVLPRILALGLEGRLDSFLVSDKWIIVDVSIHYFEYSTQLGLALLRVLPTRSEQGLDYPSESASNFRPYDVES